jgi:hypothetical protein
MAYAITGFNGRAPDRLVEVIGTMVPLVLAKVTISGTTTSEAVVITQLATIRGAIVQVLDSGDRVATSDIDVTWSGNTLTLADGGTFNLDAAGQSIYIAVWGDARA